MVEVLHATGACVHRYIGAPRIMIAIMKYRTEKRRPDFWTQ